MPGFVLPDLDYNVEFTGHKILDGLVVKVRTVSIDELLQLTERTDLVGGATVDISAMGELLDMVAGLVTGWNLETADNAPIPATREQLGRLDLSVLVPILRGIVSAISGSVEASDLGKDLPSGDPSAVLASLPTEALSASPGS